MVQVFPGGSIPPREQARTPEMATSIPIEYLGDSQLGFEKTSTQVCIPEKDLEVAETFSVPRAPQRGTPPTPALNPQLVLEGRIGSEGVGALISCSWMNISLVSTRAGACVATSEPKTWQTRAQGTSHLLRRRGGKGQASHSLHLGEVHREVHFALALHPSLTLGPSSSD